MTSNNFNFWAVWKIWEYYEIWNNRSVKKRIFYSSSQVKTTGWLGLGSIHFLYHYPRYWWPSSVSITQCINGTLSYPQLHSNPTLWNVCTVSLKWSVIMQIRIPRWPIFEHNSLNCHWSTAFISIKLEEPPVASIWSAPHSCISLEWDFNSCIRLQLFEWAIL